MMFTDDEENGVKDASFGQVSFPQMSITDKIHIGGPTKARLQDKAFPFSNFVGRKFLRFDKL